MDLQCPYCPTTRPSRSRLTQHVDTAHLNTPTATSARELRSPALVAVPDVPTSGMSEDVHVVQCVCGAPIEPMDEDTTYPDWTHVFPDQAALRSGSKCTTAIPAAGMPTKADRADLDTKLSQVGAGLDVAGREMADMRAALDAVDARMAKLDAQLISPATVRRATLNQVWDRLLDAGDMVGAAIVMKMISAVVDD